LNDAAGPVLLSNGFSQFSVMSAADGALTWTSPWAPGTGRVSVLGGMIVRRNLDSVQRARETYIDATSGRELWSLFRSPGDQYSLIVIGGTLVASVGDTVFVGYDRLTGTEKWRSRLGQPLCVAPVLCFGMKPIGVDAGDGYVLRQTSIATQIITLRENGIARQVNA
jgi:outer membrane protein assembly factor BamB